MPGDRVHEILDQHGMPAATKNTIADRDVLFEEVKHVREEGVAYDDEARLDGLRCDAVPIINNDTVERAIIISGPTSRLQNYRFRTDLPEKLTHVANISELNITYLGQEDTQSHSPFDWEYLELIPHRTHPWLIFTRCKSTT